MAVLIRAVLAPVALLLFLLPAQADALQMRCMAEALYFEARSEGWRGMLAVGIVIQNRVKDSRYPATVCRVVRQGRYWRGNPVKHKCQFSYYCDGKHERAAEKEAWGQANDIAAILMSTNVTMVGLEDSTHYHAVSVRPPWSTALKRRRQIGEHIFYAR